MKNDTKEINKSLSFLYNNIFGRLILKIATRTFISKIAGAYTSSTLSKKKIDSFIKNNNIDMSDYITEDYKSFNEFFTRRIIPEKRPFSTDCNVLPGPCDSYFSVFDITEDKAFHIKNSVYTVFDLLNNSELAKEYIGGKCLVFRLTVADYHRYAYIDNGEIIGTSRIKGILHTVNPIANARYKVYSQNTREFSVLKTDNFGKVIYMEVGAMLVGKISNNHSPGHKFNRGEEKGKFEFGGSTVILLFKKNTVEINEEFYKNTQNEKETHVRMGEIIGRKI